MNTNKLSLMFVLTAATIATSCGTQKEETEFQYNDERFADLQMLRYQVEGFDELSLRQKTLIYYLSEAALSGRDIHSSSAFLSAPPTEISSTAETTK